MLRCLIVDDEPMARRLLADYVEKVPFLTLHAACASPLAALQELSSHPIDLLLLDVQMPELTGLALLKVLPRQPLVILTTAYSEYALESYDLDVVDYLLKPITLERFLRAVHKAQARRLPGAAPVPALVAAPPAAGPAPTEPSPFLFVKDGTRLVKIRQADILFVEGLKDYVAIHTRQQRIVSLQRLKTLEQQLPATHFVRIHHSYIVSLEGIDAVFKDKVQIGSRFLPVSESYRKAFRGFIDPKSP
ncbi:LytR/AlgR family response regulator transcription factor [Hymenobacter lucidus]|uniref:LytTR family DNA-binding domain-containing protein n=1 Tax=Hymenobacter lucidus TaxID=2880930 RepID=A0ABS8ATN4_9BACT|nr:LytTR family DNA-binding domain-containing protein [Hymenobacter lucidus]MCB2409585.1 LytTR family DNA-binding domain-containing protein [Hymenobacter lucidus]